MPRDKWKNNISFILIDTAEAGNIGASARALKNCGFSKLELVRPEKFPSNESGWFAHGAEDILSRVKVHPDLSSALKDKALIIGSSRRSGKKRGHTYAARDAGERIREFAENNSVAVLFGREDRGLTNEQTAECSFLVRIPSSDEQASLNLAQAVLIIAYEISGASYGVAPPPSSISNVELAELFERFRKVMKTAGYAPKGIRDEENAIMADLRRLFARANITGREARMLHGVISQIETGLKKGD